MPERENDLSVFAEVIPDDFMVETRSWYDNIPNMPEPGHGRFEASRTYEHILNAFAEAQKEKRKFISEDVTKIFDSDKQGIENLRDLPSFNPSLDYSLKNVLAIGVWHEREEYEKEEGSTPRCRVLHQVNGLIQQTINLASSPQTSNPVGK